MVTRDEYVAGLHEVFDPIGRDVAECKNRLRGADTGPGQRHEFFDMLQGIDGDAHDTQYRVRGADTGPGQKHEFYDMLQGIDAQTAGNPNQAEPATDSPEPLTVTADDALPASPA
jgi:hypothetical protein